MATDVDVVVVGAGPCGLAAAIALKQAGKRAVVFDRSCLVSGIVGYPTYMTFFSTADRLSIGDVPFIVPTEKPTRRDAMAYYRALVPHFGLEVRQYEPVDRIARQGDGSFAVRSRPREGGSRHTTARAVVIATGYFGRPNRLEVPGEDLPHVTHRFTEGHEAFGRPAVVVGGGNSAVAAALDLHRAGADTTLVHLGPTFDRNIKPWVLPEIQARLAEDAIHGCWNARVTRIGPDAVVVATPGGERRIPALHVYLMIGYLPETALLEQLDVPIDPGTGVPTHDPATMETRVPGVFIAGVLASGFDANRTFIENGRGHGTLIARALEGGGRPSPAVGRGPGDVSAVSRTTDRR